MHLGLGACAITNLSLDRVNFQDQKVASSASRNKLRFLVKPPPYVSTFQTLAAVFCGGLLW